MHDVLCPMHFFGMTMPKPAGGLGTITTARAAGWANDRLSRLAVKDTRDQDNLNSQCPNLGIIGGENEL